MDAESLLLNNLFHQLNESGIPYAVLRNYESLPNSLGGSDIDILVATDSYNKVYDLLETITHVHGGHLISCIDDFKMSASNCRFCGKDEDSGTWWGLPIDIFVTVGLRQYEYFDTKAVIDNRLNYKNISVLSSNDAAITAFLKECLANGRSRKNYEQEASSAYKADISRYKPILEKYYGERAAVLLGEHFTTGKGLKNLKQLSSYAWRALRINAFFRAPFLTIKNYGICIYLRLLRVFNPPGFIIAVIGTDGSGKSTIIEGIRPVMEVALHKKIKYEHLRPNLLPSIATLFCRPASAGPVVDPHASKPSGFIGSLFRLSYYSLDYILGYWFKLYLSKIRIQTLFVQDRYFYDYLIDPHRSRICLPKWILKTVSFFFPQPDLILCLGAEPSAIHNRKPELPLEEVERQVRELKKFSQQNKRAVWIDTTCPIGESVDQALRAITSKMAARYERKRSS